MRRSTAVLTVTGLTLFGLVMAALPARSVVPGKNGRIVFTRETCAPTCVYTIVAADANDANETLLAGPYTRDAFDDHLLANWAPDGNSVIFMVNNGLWRVNADGNGLHQVFESPAGAGVDDGPVFTPDGQHIVFTRCCDQRLTFGYDLWMINSDGTGLKDLTKEPLTTVDDGPADVNPQVSPDGKHIVFARCFPTPPCVVATVNINGGNMRELTDKETQGFDVEHVNWSPDSKKIVFEMQANAIDIAVINADGSGLTQLTFNAPGNFSRSPCYSPDGTKILFQHRPSTGSSHSNYGIDLFTMSPDGSGGTQVTRTAANERDPEWATAQ